MREPDMAPNTIDEEAIFKVACRITAADARDEYLQQICGADRALSARVEKLLNVYHQQPTFLENAGAGSAATLDLSTNSARIGSTIGPYKIREKIAEGGMGVVYVAEQAKPVRRKVALKVIKPGMASRDVIARFEAERQALAMMDHPNIARVFDGGATESGQPYFVMELVQGLPITDYCDDKRLSTRERLELFAKVCLAVQHAHQKGIIHRDLKPSNVLVAQIDGKAAPKVIDFGVAKAVSQKLTEQTVYTQFSQMIGTPLYMSPEQAEMGIVDIDTRSDVYSLGAVLYELLTGNTPFDREMMKQVGFDEFRRVIREDAPRRPSVAVSTLHAQALSTVADRRHSDPRNLSSALKGELDWLVMKALDKDRTRRYESSSAMAADVERFLNDEPVEACPPSVGYRFRKFVQRHRGRLLTASLLAVLVLVSGAVVVSGKLENTRVQRQVNQDVEQSVAAARAAIDIGELAAARQRIGEASGRLVTSGQGLTQLIATVGELAAEVDDRYEQRQRFERFQEMARTAMDDMSYDKKLDGEKLAIEALELYGVTSDDRWLTHLQQCYLNQQEQDEIRETAYESLLVLADYVLRESIQQPTEETARASLEYLERAVAFHRPTRAFLYIHKRCQQFLKNKEETQYDQEIIHTAVATTAFDHYLLGRAAAWRGDPEKAIRLYEAALRIEPDHFNSLFFLAMRLSEDGRTSEALQVYRVCLALRPDHTPTLRNRALMLMERGELEEALELLNKTVELKSQSPTTYAARGSVYLAKGEYEKAQSDLDEAMRLTSLDDSTDILTTVNIYNHRAETFYRTGEYKKALDDLDAAVELTAKIPSKNSHEVVFYTFNNRARILSYMGQNVKALADSDYALRMAASPELTVSANSLADAHSVRGFIFEQTQRSTEALTELDKALALASKDNHELLSDIWCHRAKALHDLGRFTESVLEFNKIFEHGTNQEQTDWATASLPWLLATCPDLTVRDIPRALELANQAVESDPNNGGRWNTLGVVQYRAADLTAAIESLNKSLKLGDAGQAENLLFLAMAHSQLGQADQAREWYAKAVRWMTDNKSTEKELLRYQAEAKVALGIANETAPDTPVPSPGEGPVVDSIAPHVKKTPADPHAGSNDP